MEFKVAFTETVLINANSYKEFVEKVKKDVSNKGCGGLAFHKAIADTATFRDGEGNRTVYRWKKEDSDE